MSVKEFIDSKIDWKAYNMLLDGITKLEDVGINCFIDITVYLTHIEGNHTIPYQNSFYVYHNGELNWKPGSLKDIEGWRYDNVGYELELNNNDSKKEINNMKGFMDNLVSRLDKANKMKLKSHGFTYFTFVQIDK